MKMFVVSDYQAEDLELHGKGAIGGVAVWELVNSFEALYEEGVIAAPDLDGLVYHQQSEGYLIPRSDLIVLLGVAALHQLESKPGIISQ